MLELIFASSYVFGRQELGPELEIAVVEMTLEQQVPLYHIHFAKCNFITHNPHTNVTSFSQGTHCNVLQVERIRKRHKGNEQAVDMLKVRILAVLPC